MARLPTPPLQEINASHTRPACAPQIPTDSSATHLIDRTKQVRFQNVFPLLVLLAGFVRLVILPPDGLLALPAVNVPHQVSPGRHVPLDSFRLGDVHNGVEEVGFAMLTAEVLR